MATEPTPAVAGLLWSRIGYNLDMPARVVVRGPDGMLGPDARAVLRREGVFVAETPVLAWGAVWGSHWWVAEFSLPAPGHWEVSIWNRGRTALGPALVVAGSDHLWRETWWWVGLHQAKWRQIRATVRNGKRVGWFDAGAHWQEANSHASFLFGLCDVLEFRETELGPADLEEVVAQIRNGADYLGWLQDTASERGLADGGLVHQIFDLKPESRATPFDRLVLPGDAAKAAAVWARAAAVLRARAPEKAAEYGARAARALEWLLAAPRHRGLPFHAHPHAVGGEFRLPGDMPTPDLAMVVDAMDMLGDGRVFEWARRWLARQVPEGETEDGVHGHFRLFGEGVPYEAVWYHGVGPEGMGFNNGSTHGHHLLPLVRLLDRHPNHADAPRWRIALERYARGWLLPGCRANPFGLAPNQYVRGEGFLWFAGLWHGANAVYGNMAALALELERVLGGAEFRAVAAGNLQWIAGLNAGLTAESLRASRVFWDRLAPGEAVPVSMIHGVGDRFAGAWLNIKGSLCNGFATGDQFRWDVEPQKALDGPHSFTDEEWLTHAGGWLSGIARTRRRPGVSEQG